MRCNTPCDRSICSAMCCQVTYIRCVIRPPVHSLPPLSHHPMLPAAQSQQNWQHDPVQVQQAIQHGFEDMGAMHFGEGEEQYCCWLHPSTMHHSHTCYFHPVHVKACLSSACAPVVGTTPTDLAVQHLSAAPTTEHDSVQTVMSGYHDAAILCCHHHTHVESSFKDKFS